MMTLVILKSRLIYLVFPSKNLDGNFDEMNGSFPNRKRTNNEDHRRQSIRLALYNRYLWIRIALIHRLLHQIVEYIVNNSS